MRALFVNENIGGHQTLHRGIEQALASFPEVSAEFLDVPARGLVRRVVGASIPWLGPMDLDLAPVRFQLAQSIHVRRLLQTRLPHCDVLHAYSQHAVLTCSDLLRSRPSVVSTDSSATQNAYQLPFRSPTRFSGINVDVIRRFERAVFDAADLVVAQSEWAAGSLRETCGIADDRLRVIRFGIIPFDPPERRSPTGLPQITFVGTSLRRKGGYRLLRVFRNSLRGQCELNLVTRDHVPPEPGVRVFRDFRPGDPRLLDLFASSAVFALPSEIDKSPYAVLEAMVAGLPVVATRVGAIAEMVVDGETGILVGDDDEELAEALRTFINDQEARVKMGFAGRQRALDHFDARVTTGQLIEVLREARQRHSHTSKRAARKSRSLIAKGIGVGATVGALARRAVHTPGAVVFAYHDIGDDPRTSTSYSISPRQFREQLETAISYGTRFVHLRALVDELRAGAPIDRLGAITFDDGLAGVSAHALEVLTDLGLPATVFVVSGVLGREPPWWPGSARTMTEQELRELVAAGVHVGSHTITHRSLRSLTHDELAGELRDSRDALERLTGERVDLLAYPSGHHNPVVREAAAAAGYRAGFTFHNGRVLTGADPFALPRLTMWAGQNRVRLTYHLARPAESWPVDPQTLTV
jgi:alpha-maltose-1-phosphate synthase